jgi:hypothetical protein
MTYLKQIDRFVRGKSEYLTEPFPEESAGLNSETRKLYIRKIKELEAEYNKLPYMRPDFSIEKERKNSEKRIELFNKIQTYKSILNEE